MDQPVAARSERRGRRAMELINNEKERKRTFHGRKQCLLKKAHELSILCGIDTCVAICGDASITSAPGEPEIWPRNEVQRIGGRYLQENQGNNGKRKARVAGLEDYLGSKKVRIDGLQPRMVGCGSDKRLMANISKEQLRPLISLLGNKLHAGKEQLVAMKSNEKMAELESRVMSDDPIGMGLDLKQVLDYFSFDSIAAISELEKSRVTEPIGTGLDLDQVPNDLNIDWSSMFL